ncbi:MAG: protein kinase [Magnetococcus sp. YQC-3]
MVNTPISFVTGFLQTLDGFRDLDEKKLSDIAGICVAESFAPGQYLMHKGEAGELMYLLMEGQVRVCITDDAGKVQANVLLGPGEVVGEMALLTNEPRRADVIAQTTVAALSLNKRQTDHLLHQHPPLATFLTGILVKRIAAISGFRQIGKYQLLGELGAGATAKVYEGVHRHLGQPVAIKMLNHALVYDDLFRERFQGEARIIARLHHPNILHVYDTEQVHGTFFIIMEKLSGSDLKKMLKQVTRFSVKEASLIVYQVASALQYAHQQGILHRDVKLANCFMTETGQVKLMDFGLSCSRAVAETTGIEGSPEYLAPEIIQGKPPDERSDIYALGIMAFALLVGHTPFAARTMREVLINQLRKPLPDLKKLLPEAPGRLLQFIQGALVKDPDQRLTDWPTIFSLLERRRSGKTVEPGARPMDHPHAVVVLCPPADLPTLREALQALSGQITGLTWSEPEPPPV